MKRIALITAYLCVAIIAAIAGTYTPQDVPNVHVKDRTQFVTNPDGILSAAAVDSLNRMLSAVWEQTSAEPVVVAIEAMADGYEENRFANDLFELWGIGKKDTENGLLLLIVGGDTNRYVVRTGRGLGGILPDVTCSRIMRNVAVPHYKMGDMDAGTMAAMKLFCQAMTNPEVAAEIKSKYSNNAATDDEDFFMWMVYAGMIFGVFALIWVVALIFTSRKKEDIERYRSLNEASPVILFLTFVGLGFPLPAYLLCRWIMNHIRNHKRTCPNCQHPMHKLDEIADNDYLTPAQDAEELLNSVDYDVWLCDQCGETDIIPFENRQSSYTECQHCGARTCSYAGERILRKPTMQSEGQGVKIFACRNCRKQSFKPFVIAKTAPSVVILPGGGFGGGIGGGGGFSGGSFGGGGTSGGGASGGW